MTITQRRRRKGIKGDSQAAVPGLPHLWQPLGNVAAAIHLITKCFRYSPARPVHLCGTVAMARGPAALVRTPLMDEPSPRLRAAWYGLCFVELYPNRETRG
jgi:hypothetical protein